MRRVRLNVITEAVTKADCKGCGACCRHVGHPMFWWDVWGEGRPEEKYWTRLPKHLKREVEAHWEKRLADYEAGLRDTTDDYGEPCFWLLPDGTCKHHEYRPEVCRDFEVGGEDCLRFRREQGIVPNRRQR
jgi:Fe-S-cluster containining protein